MDFTYGVIILLGVASIVAIVVVPALMRKFKSEKEREEDAIKTIDCDSEIVDTNDQVHTMFDCPDDKQEKETQDSTDPINKKDIDDFKDDYGEEDAEDVENTKNTIIYDDNLVYSHDGRVIIKNSLLKLFLMDLSASELKIMLYFVALSDNKPYRIDMNHISDCLHITERTIKKNLASLEEKGYIIKNDDDAYTIGFEEIRLPDGKVFITSMLIDSLKE